MLKNIYVYSFISCLFICLFVYYIYYLFLKSDDQMVVKNLMYIDIREPKLLICVKNGPYVYLGGGGGNLPGFGQGCSAGILKRLPCLCQKPSYLVYDTCSPK